MKKTDMILSVFFVLFFFKSQFYFRIMENIYIYDAIKQMRNASQPFSISFVTYSKTRQTGGKIIHMKNVRVSGQGSNENINEMIAFREADKIDGDIKRCYIWSILSFNDKKIVM